MVPEQEDEMEETSSGDRSEGKTGEKETLSLHSYYTRMSCCTF